MFAVFKTGGKQYKVAKSDVVKIEKVSGKTGSVIVFDEVLAFGEDGGKVTLGTPLVSDVKVSAEVLEQKKDDKVIIFKKKRRHNYRRKNGHRQQVTIVRIQDIGKGLTAKKPTTLKKEAAKDTTKPVAAKEGTPAVNKKAPAKKTGAKKESKPEAKKAAPAKKKAAAKKTTKK